MENDTQTDHLYEILNHFRTGMFTTVSAEGRLESRPMAIAGMSDDGEVLLVTADEGQKVHQIEEYAEACLTCQSEHSRYLCLSGPVYISEDREVLKSLWNAQFQAWFPEGPESASAVLLVLVPRGGEYWDASGIRKAAYLYETTKALLRGRKPDLEGESRHGQVSF